MRAVHVCRVKVGLMNTQSGCLAFAPYGTRFLLQYLNTFSSGVSSYLLSDFRSDVTHPLPVNMLQ